MILLDLIHNHSVDLDLPGATDDSDSMNGNGGDGVLYIPQNMTATPNLSDATKLKYDKKFIQ